MKGDGQCIAFTFSLPEALALEIALMARADSPSVPLDERVEVAALRRRVSAAIKKRWPGI